MSEPVPPLQLQQPPNNIGIESFVYLPRRNTVHDRIGRHVFLNDGSHHHNRAVTDPHARHNNRFVTDPHIVPDDDIAPQTVVENVPITSPSRWTRS